MRVCPIGTAAARGERAIVGLEPAVRSVVPVVRSVSARPIQREEIADRNATAEGDVALEFVRFCYRRRRVAWPALYDEMCAVAARGSFRGMGFGELLEHGVSFCLSDLPRLVELSELIVAEEHSAAETTLAPMTLKAVPA